MKILYFAWIRERTGIGEETLSLPDGIITVRDLIVFLKGRNDQFANAFAEEKLVRAAVNQEYATLEMLISDGDEVAFFPPVTGG